MVIQVVKIKDEDLCDFLIEEIRRNINTPSVHWPQTDLHYTSL